MKHALCLAFLLASSCAQVCTIPGAFRCNGQNVETCGAGFRWLPVASCVEVNALTKDGRQWTCQVATDAGVTACLPEVPRD